MLASENGQIHKELRQTFNLKTFNYTIEKNRNKSIFTHFHFSQNKKWDVFFKKLIDLDCADQNQMLLDCFTAVDQAKNPLTAFISRTSKKAPIAPFLMGLAQRLEAEPVRSVTLMHKKCNQDHDWNWDAK